MAFQERRNPFTGLELKTEVISRNRDVFAERKLFFLLTTLTTILVAKDNIEDVVDGFISHGGSVELFTQMLVYMRLPLSMIDDLTSGNEELERFEMQVLKEHIFDMIGDGTVYDFINHAIDNPPRTKYSLDSVFNDDGMYDMDWSWYKDAKACKTAKGKSKGFAKTCEQGTKKGESKIGWWLYPKDFVNKATGGVSAKNHKSKTSKSNGTKGKPHKSSGKDKSLRDKAHPEKVKKEKDTPSKKSGSSHDMAKLFEQVGV